jgi:hypothetical protein
MSNSQLPIRNHYFASETKRFQEEKPELKGPLSLDHLQKLVAKGRSSQRRWREKKEPKIWDLNKNQNEEWRKLQSTTWSTLNSNDIIALDRHHS